MSGEDRELIFFVLSSLMVAEERITTKFSGLVGAHGSEEEATFLATQQVDEARHMQFYARFQDEVVAAPDLIAAHVARARANVSDAFRHIFDEELVQSHRRLVAEPHSMPAKVRFITLYHLILEGTLGLTTYKFTTDYLSGEGLLPGFVDGYSKIHHDETRHIGYGVWFLRRAVPRESRDAADVVRQTLRELLPSVATSLAPPDARAAGRDFAGIGATSEGIREFALGEELTRRLGDHRRAAVLGLLRSDWAPAAHAHAAFRPRRPPTLSPRLARHPVGRAACALFAVRSRPGTLADPGAGPGSAASTRPSPASAGSGPRASARSRLTTAHRAPTPSRVPHRTQPSASVPEADVLGPEAKITNVMTGRM